MSKGNKPDYNLSGLNKGTDVKGKIGVGWDKPDGSISIKLNPFVVLDGSNPDLVLTLFPYREGFVGAEKGSEPRKAPVFGGDDAGETLVQDEIPF